ncbi:hypothetical protein SASPL_108603 [Salvia splendens]|uniref:Uncharacterized protein n=1 Tax=Salvia splendens TaxID=180675 RepID=A0A8X8YJ44_SALSN|nr:hypothetical protein SASPL_108603 [Salvia splendens]
MRNKFWHHWESWKEIFGKDRAAGVRAACAGESVLKMKAAMGNNNDDPANDYHPSLDEIYPDGVIPDTEIPATGDEQVAESMFVDTIPTPKLVKKATRKHRADDQLDGVLDMMNRMHADTNDRLAMLSKRIGYDFDLSAKRTEVYDLMAIIPGLTLKQNFYACAKLVKEPELLDLFKAMPEVARPGFVIFILETDGVI